MAAGPTEHLIARETSRRLQNLDLLEAQSIHIMREAVAESERPVMLYSMGKDSSVMLRLAEKAFFPAPLPFALLHIDSRWEFQSMYELREQVGRTHEVIVYTNPECVRMGINPFDHGSAVHTDMWRTQGLRNALDEGRYDVAFGGARRDEERSRAKERVFSVRSSEHRWDPKSQRPELWNLYNVRRGLGESLRVFPLSNWTELDIWLYILRESIPLVPLYFAARRPTVERDGVLLMVDDDRMPLDAGEEVHERMIRFRTLGCYPLSGCIDSDAVDIPMIIQEMLLATISERQGRVIDFDSSGSMEKKKLEGYF
jgi:sulfate adenylyltransferase subunit 2